MSLAMISTLRERKQAYQNSSLVSPRHPRRRPSRASCHHPHHRVSRARSRCDEISRGRRRNAARVATRPRPVPPPLRTTDRTTHKKNHAFPRARPASHRRRPPRVHRLSRRHSHHRASSSSSRSPPRRRKTPHPPHRACDSNAPIVLPDTDARIRRAEIDPDRGTFSLTHDDSRCARVSPSREMSSRRGVGSRAFRVEEKLFEGWRVCVCGCVTSHHSSMGRVPARHARASRASRAWYYG